MIVTFALVGRCLMTLMRDRTWKMGDFLNVDMGFLMVMTSPFENEFRSPVRS